MCDVRNSIRSNSPISQLFKNSRIKTLPTKPLKLEKKRESTALSGPLSSMIGMLCEPGGEASNLSNDQASM